MLTRAKVFSLTIAALLVLTLVPGAPTIAAPPSVNPAHPLFSPAPDRAQVTTALQSSPVMFIENVGQFAEGARFQVRGGNGTLWLAEDAIWVTVMERPYPSLLPPDGGPGEWGEVEPRSGVNLKLSFVGANPYARLEPFNRLDTRVSYFIGDDPNEWYADVPVWGGVRYKDIYQGINLVITAPNISQRRQPQDSTLSSYLEVKNNADLSSVCLRVEGADDLTVDGDHLHVTTMLGELTVPLFGIEGIVSNVQTAVISGEEGEFDVISPFVSSSLAMPRSFSPPLSVPVETTNASELVYSTYLGGSYYDRGIAIARDESGAAYVTGATWSSDFPTTPGSFDGTLSGTSDAFVIKLSPDGSALEYATFLGGSGEEIWGTGWYAGGADIALNNGAAYITGVTNSTDFPTTPGAPDPNYNGGLDAFLVKLSPSGDTLEYSTFLGGSENETGFAIAVDDSGAVYAAGRTWSPDFPVTASAFDTTWNYQDAFIVKLNPAGDALVYATFLGGGFQDSAREIVLDEAGRVYVTGMTNSSNFPATNGAFDETHNGGPATVVAKFNPPGSALGFATYFG
ncbi:MAG: SBBP repeat-containing protein, partial [Chloroflexi bacterium]|nr:SBBP repeat-containing protein [Chloroflexota bacterium]